MLKAAQQAFVKKIPGGKLAFHLVFINHEHDFDITTDMAIRFDALEELRNANNKFLSKQMQESNYSIGIEIGNLIRGQQKRWTVNSFTDIPIVTASILTDFVQYAVPYFEKYSLVEKAYELLSSSEKNGRLNTPFPDKHAENLVGMAYLLGRGDQLPTLIESQRKLLQERKDAGLSNFESFVNKLC